MSDYAEAGKGAINVEGYPEGGGGLRHSAMSRITQAAGLQPVRRGSTKGTARLADGEAAAAVAATNQLLSRWLSRAAPAPARCQLADEQTGRSHESGGIFPAHAGQTSQCPASHPRLYGQLLNSLNARGRRNSMFWKLAMSGHMEVYPKSAAAVDFSTARSTNM
jgi:hypothetical protein